MESIYVVAGLGNPGGKYDYTRHNVGFETIDILAQKHDIKISKLKHKALSGEGSIGGKRVLLVKPQTYMNLSGESIREIIQWYKSDIKNLIIVYDDIDLPIGKLRVRPKGSSGSHNGMKSVIYQIQSDEFPRVRIGVDKPPEGWDLANFVLSRFSNEERKTIEESLLNASNAVEAIIKSGVDAAMNKYNK